MGGATRRATSYERPELLLKEPLVQAMQNVSPGAVTTGDNIESLRLCASGRCLSTPLWHMDPKQHQEAAECESLHETPQTFR